MLYLILFIAGASVGLMLYAMWLDDHAVPDTEPHKVYPPTPPESDDEEIVLAWSKRVGDWHEEEA